MPAVSQKRYAVASAFVLSRHHNKPMSSMSVRISGIFS